MHPTRSNDSLGDKLDAEYEARTAAGVLTKRASWPRCDIDPDAINIKRSFPPNFIIQLNRRMP